ncbi:hypothetical protein BKA82DRAFT_4216244 [Pisolithus tinctorius]|nr:hypothetical protein BKA82DRAFT_4216244 [Pisolithus tinctorius]
MSPLNPTNFIYMFYTFEVFYHLSKLKHHPHSLHTTSSLLLTLRVCLRMSLLGYCRCPCLILPLILRSSALTTISGVAVTITTFGTCRLPVMHTTSSHDSERLDAVATFLNSLDLSSQDFPSPTPFGPTGFTVCCWFGCKQLSNLTPAALWQ